MACREACAFPKLLWLYSSAWAANLTGHCCASVCGLHKERPFHSPGVGHQGPWSPAPSYGVCMHPCLSQFMVTLWEVLNARPCGTMLLGLPVHVPAVPCCDRLSHVWSHGIRTALKTIPIVKNQTLAVLSQNFGLAGMGERACFKPSASFQNWVQTPMPAELQSHHQCSPVMHKHANRTQCISPWNTAPPLCSTPCAASSGRVSRPDMA